MVLVLTRWENYTWGHIEVTDREREIERERSVWGSAFIKVEGEGLGFGRLTISW